MIKNEIRNKLKIIVCILLVMLLLNLSSISNATLVPIVYSEHITQSHTKEQIKQKYKELTYKFDYSNNIYAVNPVFKGAPYVAGKLQDGVITDTLNQINYFRWLYGIGNVTINQSKQERNQKGAVVLGAINKLTHEPEKPAGMDDAFYQQALEGCGVGYEEGLLYNGNIAKGEISSAHSIENFISDLYNVTPNSWVGHRLNLLELGATQASYGYCNKYTTLSIYFPPYSASYNPSEHFYAYPSAGNFPRQNFTTDEYWSLMPTEQFIAGDMKIEIVCDGVKYIQTPVGIEGEGDAEGNNKRKYPAIVFKLPDQLIDILGGEKNKMPETTIDITVSGLKNAKGQSLIYNYSVDFFNLTDDEGGGSDIRDSIVGDVDENKKITTKDAKLILQYIAGKIELTEDQKLRAETVGDGKITTKDAKLILQYIAGKIDKFPVEK